jgi:hypothetical protein
MYCYLPQMLHRALQVRLNATATICNGRQYWGNSTAALVEPLISGAAEGTPC